MRKAFFVLAILVGAASAHSTAQHQLVPVSQLRGEPALELELRKLDTVGNFMMTTAHPDDENNAMLAYFSHGKGYRTSLVTATHGEGGQNEIGPELFVPLAVLRTEELLAAHRFDGADQYFARARTGAARAGDAEHTLMTVMAIAVTLIRQVLVVRVVAVVVVMALPLHPWSWSAGRRTAGCRAPRRWSGRSRRRRGR